MRTAITDLCRDVIVREIGPRLDPASCAQLAATSHQFRSWFSHLPKLDDKIVLTQGDLVFAKKALTRSFNCLSSPFISTFESSIILYATNRFHESIESVFEVYTIVHRITNLRSDYIESCARGKILAALITAKRDSLIYEWSHNFRHRFPVFGYDAAETTHIPIPFVFHILERDDYLTVFAEKDFLPQVTGAVLEYQTLRRLFCQNQLTATTAPRLISLARAYKPFSEALREFLRDYQSGLTPGNEWGYISLWHLCSDLGIPRSFRHSHEMLIHLTLPIYKGDMDEIKALLTWLHTDMVDLQSIIKGLVTGAFKTDFILIWGLFERRGWIRENLMSAKQLGEMLTRRTIPESRVIRQWAEAQGATSKVRLIDAYMQLVSEEMAAADAAADDDDDDNDDE